VGDAKFPQQMYAATSEKAEIRESANPRLRMRLMPAFLGDATPEAHKRRSSGTAPIFSSANTFQKSARFPR
jgi:hypothetical protein